MSSAVTGPIIVGFRYRMKSTDPNRKTWLKSRKTFTTFEGAHQSAKAAACMYARFIQHQVVFDMLAEVEEQS